MALVGTKIWYPVVRDDARGFFAELWKSGDGDKKFGQIEQLNMSSSRKGVLRGMHLQHTEPMGKVMTVISGKAIFAAVCCNPEDARFREVIQLEVDSNNPTMFYADAGWARGFLALEDNTCVVYACTGRYTGSGEIAINPFSVPGLKWPAMEFIVSEKDQSAPSFREHWIQDWHQDTVDWKNVR
jgi:dTDP-4-dehydrorhamnose 3,5-epimerase